MARSTKKVGPAGRYGARYGALARRQVATIERVQKARHPCARCGQLAVRRIHTGIWGCRRCGYEFAGGAYTPETGAGLGATKALRTVDEKLTKGVPTAPAAAAAPGPAPWAPAPARKDAGKEAAKEPE